MQNTPPLPSKTGESAWSAFSRQPSRGAVCSCGDACGWHQQSVKRQGLPRALVPWPYHCFTTVCPSIKGPLLHWAFHRDTSLASANLLCLPVNQDIATALKAAAVICGHLLPSMWAFISTETLKIWQEKNSVKAFWWATAYWPTRTHKKPNQHGCHFLFLKSTK